ncbi:hypothetical protein LTR17_023161 [Elasticomyces elasticus]|nr:hypothetical protein LTR17_023161 [Elasticomyces elasticus]
MPSAAKTPSKRQASAIPSKSVRKAQAARAATAGGSSSPAPVVKPKPARWHGKPERSEALLAEAVLLKDKQTDGFGFKAVEFRTITMAINERFDTNFVVKQSNGELDPRVAESDVEDDYFGTYAESAIFRDAMPPHYELLNQVFGDLSTGDYMMDADDAGASTESDEEPIAISSDAEEEEEDDDEAAHLAGSRDSRSTSVDSSSGSSRGRQRRGGGSGKPAGLARKAASNRAKIRAQGASARVHRNEESSSDGTSFAPLARAIAQHAVVSKRSVVTEAVSRATGSSWCKALPMADRMLIIDAVAVGHYPDIIVGLPPLDLDGYLENLLKKLKPAPAASPSPSPPPQPSPVAQPRSQAAMVSQFDSQPARYEGEPLPSMQGGSQLSGVYPTQQPYQYQPSQHS